MVLPWLSWNIFNNRLQEWMLCNLIMLSGFMSRRWPPKHLFRLIMYGVILILLYHKDWIWLIAIKTGNGEMTFSLPVPSHILYSRAKGRMSHVAWHPFIRSTSKLNGLRRGFLLEELGLSLALEILVLAKHTLVSNNLIVDRYEPSLIWLPWSVYKIQKYTLRINSCAC